jgi:hypothetical protein
MNIVSFLLGILLLVSCVSKQEKKQNEIKTVVRQAEVIYSSGSDQQWQKLETKLDQLESEYETERSSYSQVQKDSINLQIGKFRAIQAKRVASGIKQDLEDIGKQAEGFIEELSK